MEYKSILFKKEEFKEESCSFFKDLKLDSLIENILRPYSDKFLEKVYKSPLKNIEDINYRQEVFRDLENKELFLKIYKFVDLMGTIYKSIEKTRELKVVEQKNKRLLDIITFYTEGARALNDALEVELKSEGLRGFKEFLENYIEDFSFVNLENKAEDINNSLKAIKYIIHGKEFKVTVLEDKGFVEEEEYLESIFGMLINEERDYLYKFQEGIEMSPVELRILEKISGLNRETFDRLNGYIEENKNFIEEKIASFYREIRFYLSYIDFSARFNGEEMAFCYPEISKSKEIYGKDIFDISLANKNLYTGEKVVKNSFYLEGKERIFIIWGPNSGGKTTFARTFGQLHYLGALGAKCPGTSCRLFLWDNIFTHFEKEEAVESLKSKLEDDVARIREILENTTEDSIVILNELFSSTALEDGLILGREVLERIIKKDCLAIFVTFIEELGSLDKTVSLVSSADKEDKSKRTFKIERKNIDGQVYGIDVAEKYGLDYKSVKERILNA